MIVISGDGSNGGLNDDVSLDGLRPTKDLRKFSKRRRRGMGPPARSEPA